LKVRNSSEGLEKLHRIAEEKGGKCLSTEYTKSYDKYRFQCGEGHEWDVRLSSLANGSWCPVCARDHRKRRMLTIEHMHELAKKHGGCCLSTEYRGAARPLVWECKNKHTWSMNPMYVENGRWCRQCRKDMAAKEMLEKMNLLAKQQKGRCLSTTYERRTIKLKWECRYGHQWEAPPGSITRGSWCPTCAQERANSQRPTLKDMHKLAATRGGKCLSTTYVNATTKLEWQCNQGHTWFALSGNIRAGEWCKTCSLKRRKQNRKELTLKTMQEWAAERGGRCLSNEYTNMKAELIWECKNGHVWITTPTHVRNGKWCPKCTPKDTKRQRITILDMQAIAKRNNGYCLSTEYIGLTRALEWQCNKGHKWFARPKEIRGGVWCPHCYKENYKNNRYSIEMMQKWAATYGGFCLSEEYVSLTHKLKWQCIHSHKWEASPQTIKYGRWCPECAKATSNS